MSTETLLEKMNLKQRLETLETDAQKTASDLNRQTDQLDGEPQKEGFAVLSFCHTSLWSSALRASSRPSSNRSSLTEEQLFELNVSAQKAAPGGTLTSLPSLEVALVCQPCPAHIRKAGKPKDLAVIDDDMPILSKPIDPEG